MTSRGTGRRRSTPDIGAFSRREDELLEQGALDEAVALNVRTFVGPAAPDEARALVAEMQRHAFELQLDGPDVSASTVEYDLSAVTARTLVVSGAHDVDYFVQIAEVLTERIPDAVRIHLEWAGHLPSLEDPERLNPVLLGFLTDEAAGRS